MDNRLLAGPTTGKSRHKSQSGFSGLQQRSAGSSPAGRNGCWSCACTGLTSEETSDSRWVSAMTPSAAKSQCSGSTQRKGVRAPHGTHTGVRGQPSRVRSSLLLWLPGIELRSSSLNHKYLYPLSQHLPFSHGFYSSNPSPHACTANTIAVPSPQPREAVFGVLT